jgi:hypothetical protein
VSTTFASDRRQRVGWRTKVPRYEGPWSVTRRHPN